MKRVMMNGVVGCLAVTGMSAQADILQSDLGYTGISGGGPNMEWVNAGNAPGDWINTYGNENATGTLYYGFTAEVTSFSSPENGGAGGSFGGFHFFRGDDEGLLLGNNWGAAAWSVFNTANGDMDLYSANYSENYTYEYIELNKPARIVFRVDYNAGADDDVTVWLDPIEGATEAYQPFDATTEFMANASFDNIHFRAGNDATTWNITDVVVATSFAEAVTAPVPEPAGLALLGLLAPVAMRRRRKN